MKSKVVEECQYAFAGGKQILNAALVTNKIVDDPLHKNKEGVLCKLDIEKAYNHVN